MCLYIDLTRCAVNQYLAGVFIEANDHTRSLLLNYLIFVALLRQVIPELIDVVVNGASADLDHLRVEWALVVSHVLLHVEDLEEEFVA